MIQLFYVFSDWGIFLLRLVLGLTLVKHGWPKIKNLKGTGENFSGMGFKPGVFWGTLVAFLEFFGGLMLVAGFFTQAISLFFVLEFAVIILFVKRKAGFVGGYEFDLLIFAVALLLASVGSGALSIDNLLKILIF
ncbi:DoxX family protein [Patescibacteria group bacterium]|nr:DoxX family protein [Patescibacteria group bacterium]